ncbi:MAG TPA: 3-dehydroquinate synthase family protein [Planctomycetota bacterium]|nr:3-dehydroquinate synthase family protein [Planctomycetota bacterium]
MKEVRHPASRIFIWPGIHAEVGETLRVLAPEARHAFILTDRKCIPIAKRVALSLIQAGVGVSGYAMYPGERRKTLQTAAGAAAKMLRTNTDRTSVFVTVGGGVVAELGGFVASAYQEGLRLFHVPTTLVAQVDAAIGSTAGVNVGDGRNVLSVSHAATAVFVDPTLLETLPRPEYLAGLAEVVKYGMVREADVLAELEEGREGIESRNPALLEEIVARCVAIKAAVEEAARGAPGVRAVLEYGRTVGRALEAAGSFRKIRSGDAQAVGMEAEAFMAWRLGVAPPGVLRAQNRILRLLDLPTRVRGLAPEKVLEAMRLNRGNPGARLNLALPRRVGEAGPGIEVPVEVAEEALRFVILPGRRIRAARPLSEMELPAADPAN